MKNQITRYSTIPRLLAVLLFFGLPFAGQADDESYIKRLFKRYAQLETYCDSGRKQPNPGPTETFERCFRNDGYFIVTTNFDTYDKRRIIVWSDGITTYGIERHIRHGEEELSNLQEIFHWPKTELAEYEVPAEILYIFEIKARGNEFKWLNSRLSNFNKNDDQSNDEYTVLEYKKIYSAGPATTTRYWISNHDFIVIKLEIFRGEELSQLIEITDYKLNPTLTLDDLSHDPPFLIKFSPFRNPKIGIPFLFISALLLGILFWLRKYSLEGKYLQNNFWEPDIAKIWIRYFIFVVVSFLLIFILGLATLPLGGHPPAIVFIWGYGYYFGLFVAAIGIFLIGAYPAYLIAKRRLSRKMAKAQSGDH